MADLSIKDTAYLQWLDKQYPGLITAFKQNMRSQLLGENDGGLVDKLINFGQGLVQLRTQKDILKVQQQRAAQGLPPLDTSSMGLPPIRIQTDVSPEMRKELRLGLKQGILIFGGIAATIAVIFYLRKRAG